ncbi:FAD-dependent oxidoreductase [bacterium]|nr:FAD-dependent oxidoreductase [bacterium]
MDKFEPRKWDYEADVVVVGTGAAGSSAALFSYEKGAKVIMVEKRGRYGGTTEKSGGVFWIPNNSFLREGGVIDKKEEALQYMARLAYPTLYDPGNPHFGLNDHQYELIEAYYENASPTIEELRAMGALEPTPWISWDGQAFPDYYAQLSEDKVPRGRGLVPKDPITGEGVTRGFEVIRQLKAAVDKRGIPVLLNHRAKKLILNSKGEVIGLEVAAEGNKIISLRAIKAVIFGSGGFTHSPEKRLNFLRGPVFGGCAVSTNEGDFIDIASYVGAKLNNTANAWWAPVVLEEVLEHPSPPTDIFLVSGDSMIYVNKYGKRVVDEKAVYHEKTQVFFYWDPIRGEYTNLMVFMIYDQRTADIWGQYPPVAAYPFPTAGSSSPYVISGQTLDELASAIKDRLLKIASKTGNFHLDPGFTENLKETIHKFNQYAETGIDTEFHRGEQPIDLAYNGPAAPQHDKPNITMYPISSKGPYYAIIIAGGTLDTKGGPKINNKAQVLNQEDIPITGLYGAGNCIASPAGQAYWAGGGTIGPALTFGHIAAVNAVKENLKEEV